MRAWTNQLSNLNYLILLPVSLIFAVFVISIARSQNSQTQPIQPHAVSTYNTDQTSVELQNAYEIPTVADNYTGNNSELLTNNTEIEASNISNTIATKAQPTATSQPVRVTPTHNYSSSSNIYSVTNSIDLSANVLSYD